MPNTYFQFKHFLINQEKSGMKVTTDGCLFGAWVADQVKQSSDNPNNILDIGAGTGLLSLMLAQVTSGTHIDALEINEEASMEASENFFGSPWNDRLNCFHLPLQKYDVEVNYNIIISNPPFFAKNQKSQQAAKNQALHNDDLSMEDLAHGVDMHLSERGTAFILFPENEMNECVEYFKKSNLHLAQKVVVRNKPGGSIFRLMGSFTRTKTQVNTTELIIKDHEGKYTDSFADLLEDYYLD